MELKQITIVYHPTSFGYSGYSKELDGLNFDSPTIEELKEKIQHLIEVRAEALAEIGKTEDAEALRKSEIILTEA